MLVHNLTPFIFGTKTCSRRPPQPEMTLVVRAAFHLRPGEPLSVIEDFLERGFLTAEMFRPDDDDQTGECLYGGDFADFKLNAEVLLRGTCYAPAGKAVAECPVLFRVGPWSKMLRVIGPRVWTEKILGQAISDPLPFTSMALSYANAFGGPAYERNPAGKGFETQELPTVELAGDVIRARGDRPEPASFGPINPKWPPRAGKIGALYGGDYQKTRAPYYAEDFDWTYFHAAPLDQQIKGYLRGDEEIVLQNLHPSAPIMETRLPGIRVRAFVNDVSGVFREIPMALDTLFADPDEERLLLTWRGVVPVQEDDLDDVKTVLIAEEPLTGERLPEEIYRAELLAFERDPTGLERKFPPGFLEASKRWDAGDLAPPPAGERDELDPASSLPHALGPLAMLEGPRIQERMSQLKAAAGSRVDVDAEIQKVVRSAADSPPTPLIPKPGERPSVGLRRQMRAVMAQTEALKKSLQGRAISDKDRTKIEALEKLPFDPRWREVDPTYSPPVGPISTDEPGPGRDLSEQDLTGRDLRGLDLRGANFDRAILTRADLRGAKLAGASLQNAVLFKADLSGADLSGANLTRANGARMKADGADLRGATLDLAFFKGASLAGAALREVKGEYTVFTGADLSGADLKRASLARAHLGETKLDRADFSGASLAACVFEGSRGEAVVMTGADVPYASFADAVLPGASLADLRGDNSIWSKATINGADFRYATLKSAFFIEASAVNANFYGANLKEARLYRAKLDRAEFVRANLFAADLSKAVLNGVKFNDANLYQAQLVKASGVGADFNGANLKRSTLEPL